MKIRFLLSTFLVLAFAAASGGAAEKSDEAAKDKPAAPAGAKAAETPETGKDGKKKMIEKGMNGDEIIQLFGKPKEIKSMESPDPALKVEQWLYRRKVKDVTTQVAVGTRMVPTYSGFNGSGNNMTEVAETEYRPQVITIFQVTALLLVNGKLETAKQWNEQEEVQQ